MGYKERAIAVGMNEGATSFIFKSARNFLHTAKQQTYTLIVVRMKCMYLKINWVRDLFVENTYGVFCRDGGGSYQERGKQTTLTVLTDVYQLGSCYLCGLICQCNMPIVQIQGNLNEKRYQGLTYSLY